MGRKCKTKNSSRSDVTTRNRRPWPRIIVSLLKLQPQKSAATRQPTTAWFVHARRYSILASEIYRHRSDRRRARLNPEVVCFLITRCCSTLWCALSEDAEFASCAAQLNACLGIGEQCPKPCGAKAREAGWGKIDEHRHRSLSLLWSVCHGLHHSEELVFGWPSPSEVCLVGVQQFLPLQQMHESAANETFA